MGWGWVDQWVGPEAWLRWSAHASVALRAGIGPRTLFLLPTQQKGQLGFGLFVSYCS